MPNSDQKILIIDDDESVLEYISTVLEGAGYNVRQAANGKDIIKLIDEHHPSLLITDVLMPECDGLEVLRNIRGHEERPKVIVMSGGGLIGRGTCLHLADAFGADAVLPKPFHPGDLFSMIEGLIAA